MSTDFDIQTTQNGDKGKIVIEAMDKDDRLPQLPQHQRHACSGPDMKPITRCRPCRSRPGRYEAEFPTQRSPATTSSAWRTPDRDGKGGLLRSGRGDEHLARAARPQEQRGAAAAKSPQRTGGRVIDTPFDAAAAQVFRREGLRKTASPLPVWDWLVPFLLG